MLYRHGLSERDDSRSESTLVRRKSPDRVEIATEQVKADKTVAKLTEKLKYRNKKVSLGSDSRVRYMFILI